MRDRRLALGRNKDEDKEEEREFMVANVEKVWMLINDSALTICNECFDIAYASELLDSNEEVILKP